MVFVSVVQSRSQNSSLNKLNALDQDLPDKFRREYTSLWKSLFTVDTKEIQRIAGEWYVYFRSTSLAQADG